MRAVERAQLVRVRGRLHALGDEAHAELPGHAHDGAADALVGRAHARDERLVELQGVHGIALEAAQRGVPAAEVVEVHGHLSSGADVAVTWFDPGFPRGVEAPLRFALVSVGVSNAAS